MEMTVGEQYDRLKRRLPAGEAEAEAGAVLAHVLGCEQDELYLRFSDPCPAGGGLERIVQKRLEGTPLAYVLGYRHFYGYRFYVDKRVLIPRWDSECVVEYALRRAAERGCRTALDLCCGSGCMGAALMMDGGFSSVDFADISTGALDVARVNVEALLRGAAGKAVRRRYIPSNLFSGIEGMYDLIVCNPPYIGAEEYARLDAQIRDFEPEAALLAGNNGYQFYEALATRAGAHLNGGGLLVMEIGSTQKEKVMGFFDDQGFQNITSGRDLAGRDRFVSADWY